ncbi:MAG: nucleotidyltransferase family protein [Clostridia bacterium]|nr:nucleotidyltransferase family protein [Clostridia bacterium]
MGVIGIIAEFNPLHKGHEYLINEAKKQGTVVCVISGNFVQRGDTAIAEKRVRALAALRCGADLVIELPVIWSMSTAQSFALGGVSALKAAGCDKIMFGSECGNISKLLMAADILQSSAFSEKLNSELKSGITFAKARQNAAEALGLKEGVLSGANNNLAIEYILAARSLGFACEFETVARRGAGHDTSDIGEFVSASLLREKMLAGELEFCRRYMPQASADLILASPISDIARLDRAILAVLRAKSQKDLARLPDISEGVENKLFSAIRLATDLEGLYNTVKVKRYTHARIRRLALSAFLGFDNSYFMKPVPFLRILGFNSRGELHLKECLSKSEIPLVLRTADINSLSDSAKKVFETESRATDLYSLSLPQPLECGLEYTSKIIKLEC